MRLGVLDIGSNTGHLLVVDAHRGAAPLPAYSHKEPLRLAEHLDDGELTADGIAALTRFVADAVVVAEDKGSQDMLGFATSAVRDARNCDAVLEHVAQETGVRIAVLPGADEARPHMRDREGHGHVLPEQHVEHHLAGLERPPQRGLRRQRHAGPHRVAGRIGADAA